MIRAAEKRDFAASEKELMATIDMVGRAIGILEKEMQAGSSMLQAGASSLTGALAVMVQASLISQADSTRLTALVQDSQKASDTSDDEALGAPAADVYESHSGNIVDTLQGLIEQAESQLADARKKETASVHEFQLLEQSLDDAIKVETGELNDAKQAISASKGEKSAATQDLDVTSSDLAAAVKAKETLQHNCMTKASTHEAEAKSRAEELSALAEAKKVIAEATGSAALTQASFMQVARSKVSQGSFKVVRLIRDLAQKQGSGALMQLVSRMSSAMDSKDSFAKIKGLISEMIARLEKEAGEDATKKAYCDKELSETSAKKVEKSNEIAKLSTRIDRMVARSAQLKEEVAAIQNQLAELAKSQASMDKLRREEKAAFAASKAELEKGITGLKLALKILNGYYGSA